MYIPALAPKKTAKKGPKIVKDTQRPTSRAHLNWVKMHRCSVEDCATGTRIDPHHVKTRGAGGGDHWAIPMCRQHHDEIAKVNGGPWTFQRKYGIDMYALAVHFASHSKVREIRDAVPTMVRPEEKQAARLMQSATPVVERDTRASPATKDVGPGAGPKRRPE